VSAVPLLLVERMRSARSVLVLTGAGVSAESGIPTFRDALSGLWARYRPEDLATPEAFARQPDLVWRWYQWRRRIVDEAQPNPGHRALAALQNCVDGMMLVTQNVDGLHQRAGSADVVELHGNLFEDRCSAADCAQSAPAASHDQPSPPPCPRCGAPLRPGVVWFGEPLPEVALERAARAAGSCDLVFSVGTSALVYPAAELAWIAARSGAAVVEINPEPTPLTEAADFVFSQPGGVALPAILRAMGPDPSDGADL